MNVGPVMNKATKKYIYIKKKKGIPITVRTDHLDSLYLEANMFQAFLTILSRGFKSDWLLLIKVANFS